MPSIVLTKPQGPLAVQITVASTCKLELISTLRDHLFMLLLQAFCHDLMSNNLLNVWLAGRLSMKLIWGFPLQSRSLGYYIVWESRPDSQCMPCASKNLLTIDPRERADGDNDQQDLPCIQSFRLLWYLTRQAWQQLEICCPLELQWEVCSWRSDCQCCLSQHTALPWQVCCQTLQPMTALVWDFMSSRLAINVVFQATLILS